MQIIKYKVNIHKSILFLYTHIKQLQNKNSLYNSIKNTIWRTKSNERYVISSN